MYSRRIIVRLFESLSRSFDYAVLKVLTCQYETKSSDYSISSETRDRSGSQKLLFLPRVGDEVGVIIF